ncbi:thiamine pyrophosphokinase [Lunatibacter salilacus]|uniref:thiamine pyrophosphokinase n=1 Tax=Lunatibacter salilacus TaxID=2483804 RepID=UPI00131D675B|nr:thiamine pyrophosphokinase [Lunatibacter salilacus]
MSSHHFVKEQQEPALMILHADDYDFDLVSEILEWSPTVVVTQDALDKVLSWGIKIDRVVADAEFVKNNTLLLEEQFPLEFLIAEGAGFLNEGLNYLLASGHTAVVILGFDHTQVKELEPMLPNLNLVIYDGPIRYYPVKSGILKKWLPAGSVQLHAPENSFIELTTSKGSRLIRINHATFVEVEEGLVTFKGNGVFWIGEFLKG